MAALRGQGYTNRARSERKGIRNNVYNTAARTHRVSQISSNGRWHPQECVVKYPRVGVFGSIYIRLEIRVRGCNRDPYVVVVEYLMQIH